jgi:hypothetical protein
VWVGMCLGQGMLDCSTWNNFRETCANVYFVPVRRLDEMFHVEHLAGAKRDSIQSGVGHRAGPMADGGLTHA